jgi:hypothetical protein
MKIIRQSIGFAMIDSDLLRRCFVVGLMLISIPLFSQNHYWVGFKNKQATPGTFANPQTYLSQRAIDRRVRQGIAIDSTDLPVSPVYLNKIKQLPLEVVDTSKWMNGVIIKSNDATISSQLTALGFVTEVHLTKGTSPSLAPPKIDAVDGSLKGASLDESFYGIAYNQINTVNGVALHEAGYKGAGMHIAVIDNGFYQVDVLPLFGDLIVLGTRDFVMPGSNVYQGSTHGMSVLSVMAGYDGATPFCGTAPEASYWLLRTEDAATESPVEADYWVRAAEFADSVGADIIQSSLGYFTFDNTDLNYTYADLNGTTRISRAANLAVGKGMVVVVAAGNEGNKAWKYITTPGDASDVLSIGGVKSDLSISPFSGWRPMPDGRIKPDVVAMGEGVAIQISNGSIGNVGSGTSFAAPIISGLAACLWQSLPHLNATDIIAMIRQSATRQSGWDINRYGYGVPDFDKAWQSTAIAQLPANVKWKVWPNPFASSLTIDAMEVPAHVQVVANLYNTSGTRVWTTKSVLPVTADNLDHLPRGIYVLTIDLGSQIKTLKLIKQ